MEPLSCRGHLSMFWCFMYFIHTVVLALRRNIMCYLLYLGQGGWSARFMAIMFCTGTVSLSFECCPGTVVVTSWGFFLPLHAHYHSINIDICVCQKYEIPGSKLHVTPCDLSPHHGCWLYPTKLHLRQLSDSYCVLLISHLILCVCVYKWTRHNSTYWISHLASKKPLIVIVVAGLISRNPVECCKVKR